MFKLIQRISNVYGAVQNWQMPSISSSRVSNANICSQQKDTIIGREFHSSMKPYSSLRHDMKENQHIEYKRNWRDEYLKWICAFANADGGELLIGVEDDGTVGIDNSGQLLEELPNKIASTMGLVCPVDAIERDGKPVVRITVKPSSAPVGYHGKFHIRCGATKQLLTGPALTQFILEKTGTK